MSRTPVDYLHGTLETLILKTLTRSSMHGYAIARWIEDATHDAFAVEEGSLYPALYRMEKKGWVEAEWGTSELGAGRSSIGSPGRAGSNWPATRRRGTRLPRRSPASSSRCNP